MYDMQVILQFLISLSIKIFTLYQETTTPDRKADRYRQCNKRQYINCCSDKFANHYPIMFKYHKTVIDSNPKK